MKSRILGLGQAGCVLTGCSALDGHLCGGASGERRHQDLRASVQLHSAQMMVDLVRNVDERDGLGEQYHGIAW